MMCGESNSINTDINFMKIRVTANNYSNNVSFFILVFYLLSEYNFAE